MSSNTFRVPPGGPPVASPAGAQLKVSPFKGPPRLNQASTEDILKELRARRGQQRGKKSASDRTNQAQTELKQARELENMLIEKALQYADESWTPAQKQEKTQEARQHAKRMIGSDPAALAELKSEQLKAELNDSPPRKPPGSPAVVPQAAPFASGEHQQLRATPFPFPLPLRACARLPLSHDLCYLTHTRRGSHKSRSRGSGAWGADMTRHHTVVSNPCRASATIAVHPDAKLHAGVGPVPSPITDVERLPPTWPVTFESHHRDV